MIVKIGASEAQFSKESFKILGHWSLQCELENGKLNEGTWYILLDYNCSGEMEYIAPANIKILTFKVTISCNSQRNPWQNTNVP